MTSRRVILIGGAPTTGKSTIASELSESLGLPWISTDQIREVMRLAANRKDRPNLFEPRGYDAKRFLTEFSTKKIVVMELRQGEATWPGVKQFIEDDYRWKRGCIIEGAGILPRLVSKDFAGRSDVRSIFLVDENPVSVRKVIFERGLWDDARAYPDSVKEKEVEWALLFGRTIKAEAEKFGLPWMQVKRDGNDPDSIRRALALRFKLPKNHEREKTDGYHRDRRQRRGDGEVLHGDFGIPEKRVGRI